MLDGVERGGQMHRRVRSRAALHRGKIVRHEGAVVESPQKVIERLGVRGAVRSADHHAHVAQVSLLGEAAGESSSAARPAALFKT